MNNPYQQKGYFGFVKLIAIVLVVLFFPATIFTQELRQNPKETIILSDSNDITVKGLISKNIRFFFSRSLIVQVNDSTGLTEFSKITLPESFDPQTIIHQSKYRNYQHGYIFMEVNDFKVRIMDKSGKHKEAEVKRKENQILMTPPGWNFYEKFSQFAFHITNLALGDKVYIDYQYSVSFLYHPLLFKELYLTSDMLELSSIRVFFHGRFDKEKFRLTLSHPEEMQLDFKGYNNGNSDTIFREDKMITRSWKKNSLKGCIAETGARPHNELPYFVFTIRPVDWFYTLPNSYEERAMPVYAIIAKRREEEVLRATRNMSIGTNNKDYVDLRQIYSDMTKGVTNDSTGYKKVKTVINVLANDFSFHIDTNYFRTKNMYMDEMGEFLKRRMIRDICRYETYTAFLAATQTDYFTAYLSDKRCGVIDNQYFKPMLHNDMLMVSSLKDSSLHWFNPKHSKFTLLLNELPFYYENTTARLVHFSDWAGKDQPINEQFREIKTPNSELVHNYRRCSALGQISLDSKIIQFETKIDLSGQFSTLTRGVYKFDEIDPSINPLYGEKIWEIGREVFGLRLTTNLVNDEFPFNANVTAHYSFNDLVNIEGEIASISLSNWFKHVINKGLNTKKRCLDYYPDFMGKDNFSYLLRFNQAVLLVDSVDIQIINNFADYRFQIVQRDAQTVLITSSLFLQNERIPAEKIGDVLEIFQAIQRSNTFILRLKLNP